MTDRVEWQRSRIEDGLKRGEFVIKDGRPVCSTCGGNCGQCGNTDILGNIPFDFETIVNSATTEDGRPALRHTNPGFVARIWKALTK